MVFVSIRECPSASVLWRTSSPPVCTLCRRSRLFRAADRFPALSRDSLVLRASLHFLAPVRPGLEIRNPSVRCSESWFEGRMVSSGSEKSALGADQPRPAGQFGIPGGWARRPGANSGRRVALGRSSAGPPAAEEKTQEPAAVSRAPAAATARTPKPSSRNVSKRASTAT
jgi:hypothetical protein